MNRLLTTLCVVLSLHFYSAAQQYDGCMEVVSSSGGQGIQTNLHLSWTLGEPFITTIQGAGYAFTQGFHQPDACGTEFVGTNNLSDWGLSLFPNPSSGWFTLQFSSEKNGPLLGSAYDLLGRTLFKDQALNDPGGSNIDATTWPPGLYIIVLRDPATKASSILRVVRL